jgi:hypothetical protein
MGNTWMMMNIFSKEIAYSQGYGMVLGVLLSFAIEVIRKAELPYRQALPPLNLTPNGAGQ